MLSYWDILQAHKYCLFNLTCITSMQLTSPTRTITSASQGSLLFTYLIPSLHYNSVFPTSRSHLLIPFIAWSWSTVPICSWVKTKLHCGLSQLQSMRAHVLTPLQPLTHAAYVMTFLHDMCPPMSTPFLSEGLESVFDSLTELLGPSMYSYLLR